MDAWDRSPEESPQAWQAFQVYRDTGAERSLAKTADAVGKSVALMERWSSRHDWVRRADAFDVWLDTRAREDSLARHKRVRHVALETTELAVVQLRERLGREGSELRVGELARVLDSLVRITGVAEPEPEGQTFESLFAQFQTVPNVEGD